MNKDNHILTIAIPTYNRSKYLERCLQQIYMQIFGYENEVNVLVVDNCSSDDTKSIVHKFIDYGLPICYVRNQENIGADFNIIKAYDLSQGEYVLVLGDDDVLVDGALEKIINVLKDGVFGAVYLSSYAFKEDFRKEYNSKVTTGCTVYESSNQYLKNITYYCTFISSNICNKKSIKNVSSRIDWNLDRFKSIKMMKYNLYILSSIFSDDKKVIIKDKLIAAQVDNTGGYNLCKTFGVEFNDIMNIMLKNGLEKKTVNKINRDLLMAFFPINILKIRMDKKNIFYDKFMYSDLFIQYKNSLIFWIAVFPIIKLPVMLAKCYLKLLSCVNKVNNVMRL